MRERIFFICLLVLGAGLLYDGFTEAANAADLELPSVAGVQVVHAPCPAYSEPISCADLDDRVIYVIAGRRALAHETCHFIDHDFLTDADRAAFMGLRGMAPPWTSQAIEHNDRPAERFAQDCALCSLGKRWRGVRKIIQPPCGWLKRTLTPEAP